MAKLPLLVSILLAATPAFATIPKCNIKVEFGEYNAAELAAANESFEKAQESLNPVWDIFEGFGATAQKTCNTAMAPLSMRYIHQETCLAMFAYTYGYMPSAVFSERMEQINNCVVAVNSEQESIVPASEKAVLAALRPTSSRVPIDWQHEFYIDMDRLEDLGISADLIDQTNYFTALKLRAQRKLYRDNFAYMSWIFGPSSNIRFWRNTLAELNEGLGTKFSTIAEWRKWDEAEHIKYFLGLESAHPRTLEIYANVLPKSGYAPADVKIFLRRHLALCSASERIMSIFQHIEHPDTSPVSFDAKMTEATKYEMCLATRATGPCGSETRLYANTGAGDTGEAVVGEEKEKAKPPAIMCFMVCVEMDEKWQDIIFGFFLVFIVYHFCKNTFLYKKKPLKLKD